jgi:hypothetical protein
MKVESEPIIHRCEQRSVLHGPRKSCHIMPVFLVCSASYACRGDGASSRVKVKADIRVADCLASALRWAAASSEVSGTRPKGVKRVGEPGAALTNNLGHLRIAARPAIASKRRPIIAQHLQ